MGKGAICAVCHNTRNGVHGDSLAPTGYATPHSSAETDVLLARNAYFTSSVPSRAPHAFVADACLGCHMASVPSPAGLSYPDQGRSHTFEASFAGCVGCHPGMNGADVSATLDSQLSGFATMLSAAVTKTLNDAIANGTTIRVRAWNPVLDEYSSPTVNSPQIPVSNVQLPPGNPVVGVEIVEIHGQVSLHISLTSAIPIVWSNGEAPSTDVWAQLVHVKDLTGGHPGIVIYAAADNLVKASWNYLLLSYGAGAAHNPTWAQAVIESSMAQDLSLVW